MCLNLLRSLFILFLGEDGKLCPGPEAGEWVCGESAGESPGEQVGHGLGLVERGDGRVTHNGEDELWLVRDCLEPLLPW